MSDTIEDAVTRQAQRIEPNNADYDALFAMTSTPTLELDEVGRVLRANPAACRLLEQSAEQLAGRLLDDLLGVDVTAALASRHAHEVEVTLPHGPEPARLRSFVRSLASSQGERMTVQLTRAMSRKGRDAALRGDVVGWSIMDDLSHNLGTPLSIVAGYSETLRDHRGAMDGEDVRAAAEAIHRNAQRAIDELRALQARARVTVGGAGSMPTSVLVAWMRRVLSPALETNNAVLVGTATTSMITVDVSVARQVLLNLCRAELEAAPTDATIELEIRARGRGTEFLVTSFGGPALDDTMTAATAALAGAAGGTFTPASPDGGHHVVWLPDTSTRGAETRPSIRVAVIEDDHDTAAIIRASLSASSGMFEIVADERTFAAGLLAVTATRPRIVLLDQHLPDRLGTDGIEEVQRAAPMATVVVLSRAPAGAITSDHVVWLEKSRVLADLERELISVLGAA